MPDKRWLDTLELYSSMTCEFTNQSVSENYEQNQLKREKIYIPKFDYYETIEIGLLARKMAKEEFPDKTVVIDISLENEHCLFRVVTGVGSSLDDDYRIQKNREVAMRFGFSNFFMGLKFKSEMGSEQEKSSQKKEDKFDGGVLPIFTDACEFPVAYLTVTGLKPYENHWLAVESVRDYVIKFNSSAGRYTVDDAIAKHKVDCAICLSDGQIDMEKFQKTHKIDEQNYKVTPCNHVFHDECLTSWMDYNLQCPVCKSPLQQKLE